MADNNGTGALGPQAAYVRELYCEAHRRFCAKHGKTSTFGWRKEMPRWDGGTDANGTNYKPVWPKVVVYCLEGQMDPATLIRAVFDCHQGSQPPTPNTLTSDYAKALYTNYAAEEADDLKRRLRYYNEMATKYFYSFSVRDKLDAEQAWVRTLMQDPPTLSPLFRYCLAKKMEMEDVADYHEVSAFSEYFWSRKAYDGVWGDFIPQPLREAADLEEATLRRNCRDKNAEDDRDDAGLEGGRFGGGARRPHNRK